MTRRLITVLLGLVCSFPFVYLGGAALFGAFDWHESSALLLLALGAATLLYGVTSVVLLGLAWRRPRPHLARVSAGFGAMLVLAWGLGSLDYGSLTGLEWVVVLGLAATVAGVWWSVRSLSSNATSPTAS